MLKVMLRFWASCSKQDLDLLIEVLYSLVAQEAAKIQKSEKKIADLDRLDTNAPRDFIDMMLIEIQNTTDPTSTFYGQLGMY